MNIKTGELAVRRADTARQFLAFPLFYPPPQMLGEELFRTAIKIPAVFRASGTMAFPMSA